MHLGEPLPFSEEQCFEHALAVDEVVRKSVAEYSINPQEIENQIKLGLLPLLCDDIGIEKAQTLMEDVIRITWLGLSGQRD